MKRIGIVCGALLALLLAACGSGGGDPQAAPSGETGRQAPLRTAESSGEAARDTSAAGGQTEEASAETGASGRQIRMITEEGHVIVFSLNGSAAAEDLAGQLPLRATAEDYGRNEKIFYPPEKLNTSDAPPAQGPAGTLAYYEPWGDVAIFYGECGGAEGLFELGEAVSGAEFISQMTGEIQIEAAGEASASADGMSSEENTAMKMNVQTGVRERRGEI